MTPVLRPAAINIEQFTPWKTLNKAIRMLWNILKGTVSISADKIKKATRLIERIICDR